MMAARHAYRKTLTYQARKVGKRWRVLRMVLLDDFGPFLDSATRRINRMAASLGDR